MHHLAHHCVDVAACFEAICSLPTIRARLAKAAGRALSAKQVARLAIVAFLHDAGKLHPGFQAKGWPSGVWRAPWHGHVREGAALFTASRLKPIARHLHLETLYHWGVTGELLFASFSHHGRPLQPADSAQQRWDAVRTETLRYDPEQAARQIGALMPDWFPLAFEAGGEPLPEATAFQHLFCGLVSLADWLGSDARFFKPDRPDLDLGYVEHARRQARDAVHKIGLDVAHLQRAIEGRTAFADLTGIAVPRPQQRLVGDFPLDELLLILEAATGAGKTEAALWRFVRLFEAGLVDSLYFALPTRSAAVQLHGRVNKAMRRLFGSLAPEAVLAVPGYLRAGEAEGQSLPHWDVLWDDDADENRLLARWAAENARRYLAATIAVGTVDQAMLSALPVKHAHLRSAALSRSLLVIDEVHASDTYMLEIQKKLLDVHLGRGGHAMLMSATLGSHARAKWLSPRRRFKAPGFAEAVAEPYPAVWGRNLKGPRFILPDAARPDTDKVVTMRTVPTMAAQEAARIAIDAANRGARVLLIRNTVDAAIETARAVEEQGGARWLLPVNGIPTLHHSRFAPEDRKLLDAAVEQALSPKADVRPPGGAIIIGTQTLEQSLDIDGDILLTDLCPVDVMLQRIGRLHRHPLPRPAGFETPQCLVMVPEDGLTPLLLDSQKVENGLGTWMKNGVPQGIYGNLSILELTHRLIADHAQWRLPAMNRLLVESATNDECLEALHQELGPEWQRQHNMLAGVDTYDAQAAKLISEYIDKPFDGNWTFPDDEKIRTRLGEEGARVMFTEPIIGPFGEPVTGIALPVHWSQGLDTQAPIRPEQVENGWLIRIDDRTFRYGREGLMRA